MVLTAILLFAFYFLAAAFVAWGGPWRAAFTKSVFSKQYDDDFAERIARQVRRRIFTRTWLASAILGSLLGSSLAFVPEPWSFMTAGAGMILIVAFGMVQGWRLCSQAMTELGYAPEPNSYDS